MNPVLYFWILGAHYVTRILYSILDSRSTYRDMNSVLYFWTLGAHDVTRILYSISGF